jgi:hypothetical protein
MSNLIEAIYDDVELVTESTSAGKKFHYIHGIFAQADVVNGNKRVYPEKVLDESMNGYISDFVSKSRAVGCLTHPSTTSIDLDRVSHLITEMRKDGKNYVGKARILNTPTGKIVQALLEGGVKLGVSTRADGKVITNSRGLNEVAPGLGMKAIDIVYNPSAPDALVDSIMESVDTVMDALSEDMQLVESIREDIRRTSSKELQAAKIKAFRQIMEHLTSK